ncbi:SDR family NAD(P)-dependent oxidoreductase [Paenibacillus pinisoli]|uniref:SDR family NAD(P)-dependent oxidoreductase n=1 Tax=Paenibacillus pinisoli TaxID=1276110 RepID=A0A3A6Q3T2_9BACL|nr:SDR family NAD(P)-dependent oxidoreductase [Paenibacillus pinisoli]RJX40574.1 SDR family NAD(P)-dependent oxidoreductase [Paenibacillus pinisoli]
MSKPSAVIVGAGPGIGLSVAKAFGKHGYRVILVSRNEQSLQLLVSELLASNIEAHCIQGDAGETESIESAFQNIKASYGSPEVLVYNAAALQAGLPTSLTPDQLSRELTVNVSGALASALQVIPGQEEQGKGTILFTGGGFALHPSTKYASLSLGKAALRSLAFSLGEELAPKGIHVGIVTIAGYVAKDTHFDPDRIAEVYWHLHANRQGHEVVYEESQVS